MNVRKGEISIERAKGAFAEILLLGIELDFPQDHALSLRALELAQKYALPATYDAHYLALLSARTANSGLLIAVCGELYRENYFGYATCAISDLLSISRLLKKRSVSNDGRRQRA